MPSFSESGTRRLETQIKASEGLRLEAYHCAAGALTIGYGHNCDASPVPGVTRAGDRITLDQAEALFSKDLAHAVRRVREELPWVPDLDPARQAVLYDMAFNMGIGHPGVSGLLSFQNTLHLIRSGDCAEASRNMLVSRWAKQVGFRAVKLSRQMETGEWQ